MSMLPVRFGDKAFADAIQKTLENEVRNALKEPLMKLAEEQVDEAVAAAVKQLDIKANLWSSEYDRKNTIEVLLRKEQEPA